MHSAKSWYELQHNLCEQTRQHNKKNVINVTDVIDGLKDCFEFNDFCSIKFLVLSFTLSRLNKF